MANRPRSRTPEFKEKVKQRHADTKKGYVTEGGNKIWTEGPPPTRSGRGAKKTEKDLNIVERTRAKVQRPVQTEATALGKAAEDRARRKREREKK